MERMLLWLAGGLALGNAAGVLFSGNWLLLGMLAGLFGAALLSRQARWRRGVLLLAGLAVGLAAVWYQAQTLVQPLWALAEQEVLLEGRVEDCDPMDYGSRYRIAGTVTDPAGQCFPVRLTVYSYVEPQAEMGQQVSGTVTLTPAEHASEFGRGNFVRGLARKGFDQVSPAKGLWGGALRLKKTLLDTAQSLYTPVARGMVRSVLLNDRQELDWELQEVLQNAGAAHLLAVSGLHVSLLFAGVGLLLRRGLRLGPKSAAAASLPVLGGYVLLTGSSASILRAGIMSGCRSGAQLLDMEYDGLCAWSLAGIVLLAGQPYRILDAGFQLSMAATGGILFFAPTVLRLWDRLLPAWLARWEESWWQRQLRDSFCISLCATAGVAPVLLCRMGYLSPYSFLSTMLALWALPALFVCGGLSLALGSVPALAGLAGPFVWGAELAARWILLAARWVSMLPGSAWYSDSWVLFGCCVALLVLLALLTRCPGKRRAGALCLGWLLVCSAALGAESYLTRGVLKVSRTEEAVILTQDGQGAFFGNLSDQYQLQTVRRRLKSAGVTQLALCLATEGGWEESEYLDQLLREFPARQCLVPGRGPYLPFVRQACPSTEILGEEARVLPLWGEWSLTTAVLDGERAFLLEDAASGKKLLKTGAKYDIIIKDSAGRQAFLFGEEALFDGAVRIRLPDQSPSAWIQSTPAAGTGEEETTP